MAAYIVCEKTLGDVMRSAAQKSRRLSSPKSKAGMLKVVLQNRIVKNVNNVLTTTPLSARMTDIDARFISLGKLNVASGAQQEKTTHVAPITWLWQLQHSVMPTMDASGRMKFSSADPSDMMECASEDLSDMMECASEEFSVIGEDEDCEEETQGDSTSVLRKRSADDAFGVIEY